MKDFFIHLFHILLVGSLFLYVGIVKSSMPSFMYPILLTLGIIIILYHGFKAYRLITLEKNPWVNYIHIFIIFITFTFFFKERDNAPSRT